MYELNYTHFDHFRICNRLTFKTVSMHITCNIKRCHIQQSRGEQGSRMLTLRINKRIRNQSTCLSELLRNRQMALLVVSNLAPRRPLREAHPPGLIYYKYTFFKNQQSLTIFFPVTLRYRWDWPPKLEEDHQESRKPDRQVSM